MSSISVRVLFNGTPISEDHLMPRKVRLVLSPVWVFMIVFDYICTNIGEKVFFFVFFLKTQDVL